MSLCPKDVGRACREKQSFVLLRDVIINQISTCAEARFSYTPTNVSYDGMRTSHT